MREGDQLELWAVREEYGYREVPWRGLSPRALTRVALSGIFKAQAVKSMSDFVNPEQCDLWLPRKKAPWKYQGASLLGSQLCEEVKNG